MRADWRTTAHIRGSEACVSLSENKRTVARILQPKNALRVCVRRETSAETTWKDGPQGTRSHMLTRSLPPIPELSEAGATESLACIAPEGGERGGRRVSVAMCSGSLLSAGSMEKLVCRADMAMLYRSATTQAAPKAHQTKMFSCKART